MSGVLDSNWLYLYNLRKDNPIDLKAIIFAMIIVGAVGAVMDVAMSGLVAVRDKRKIARSTGA